MFVIVCSLKLGFFDAHLCSAVGVIFAAGVFNACYGYHWHQTEDGKVWQTIPLVTQNLFEAKRKLRLVRSVYQISLFFDILIRIKSVILCCDGFVSW